MGRLEGESLSADWFFQRSGLGGASGDLGLRVRLGLGEARVTIEPDMLDGMRGRADRISGAAEV